MEPVVLVSPDTDLCNELSESLARENLLIKTAAGSGELWPLLEHVTDPTLILEIFLEDESGFSVCRSLRENDATSELPIIMLARAQSEMDRILAFEAGVDDVVTWPLPPRELALRVRAVLRRSNRGRPVSERDEGVIKVDTLSIDFARRRVRCGDNDVNLTVNEFEILALLAQKPGFVFTRDAILAEVWGSDQRRTIRVVDTHVRGIRRKLDRCGPLLETVWSVGYRLNAGGKSNDSLGSP